MAQEEKYSKEATQYQILQWYIEIARSLARCGGLLKTGYRISSLSDLSELLNELSSELDELEGQIDLFPWTLFTQSDIQKVSTTAEAMEEAKQRPGRKKVAEDIDADKRAILLFRLDLADRYTALRLQFASMRVIMFSNDWFTKGFQGHRESTMKLG